MAGHKGQVVGYVRVSAADQNEVRQLEALGTMDRLFSEKASGKTTNDRVLVPGTPEGTFRSSGPFGLVLN